LYLTSADNKFLIYLSYVKFTTIASNPSFIGNLFASKPHLNPTKQPTILSSPFVETPLPLSSQYDPNAPIGSIHAFLITKLLVIFIFNFYKKENLIVVERHIER